MSPATNENRPYHHAYANDYDAGGGTRRANDVLLDGVPLGASYKTSYTPSMDAVEEITISKNSVDAENGNSLGGIISLNMKSGTNTLRGSGYAYFRDPQHELAHRPDARGRARACTPLRGSTLQMYRRARSAGRSGRTGSSRSRRSRTGTTSRPLSIVRTVPTELERRGDFSQSVLNGRGAHHLQPVHLDARRRAAASCAQPFAGNVDPAERCSTRWR